MIASFRPTAHRADRANTSAGIGRACSQVRRCTSAGSGLITLPNFPPPAMGVSTGPGHRTLTRTPCIAASTRSDVDSPTTACFVAL